MAAMRGSKSGKPAGKGVRAASSMKVVKKKKTLSSIAGIAHRLMAARASASKSSLLPAKSKEKDLREKERQRQIEKIKEMDRRSRLSREENRLEALVSKDFGAVCKIIADRDAQVCDSSHSACQEPAAVPDVQMGDSAAEAVVDTAMNLFKDAWLDYALERDRGNMDGEDREDRAAGHREQKVAEEFDKLKDAFVKLLPFVGTLASYGDYLVLERTGYQPPQHLAKGERHWKLLGERMANKVPLSERLLGARLACLRRTQDFRAFEAFAAMMATIAGRKEKSWIELFGTREDIELELKNKAGCKTKGSATRNEMIKKFLEKEALHGFGFFAHFLVMPKATFRVAFASAVPSPIPVSLIITTRLPLYEVLASENADNGDAPMIGEARHYSWCAKEGTQFAIQDANFAVKDTGGANSRKTTADLRPEDDLRELLLDRTKEVVHLDVCASLAPRELAKRDGR